MKKIKNSPKEQVKKFTKLQPLPLTQLETVAAGLIPCPDCPDVE